MGLRPWRAFLLAPLATPLAYWADMLIETGLDPGRHGAGVNEALNVLPVVIISAAPAAYPATLALGIPLWLLARRRGLPAWAAVSVGAIGGVATAYLIGPSLRGELFSIPMGPWRGAALGAITAAVWWRLLRPAGRTT
jgi:hypothetical protein